MRTVGFDFGTHQSKICVEYRNGVEENYEFLTFLDTRAREQYTIPSIIQIDEKGILSYGYVRKKENSKIIRYFKQATFTDANTEVSKDEAIYYSIWYVSYILFDLESKYGIDFSIQAGVPSDGAHLTAQKELAIRIIMSAYRLVEDVFKNKKNKFLATPITELKELTEIVPYTKYGKSDYCILIFPEAYACLMPLIKSEKIATGMSVMVDIGGGTTDISFFTINEGKPQVYDFISINKGLNFLTDFDVNSIKQNDNVTRHIIQDKKKKNFRNEISTYLNNLIKRLRKELKRQSKFDVKILMDALKSRPIIYSGGGSMEPQLRMPYGEFKDIIHISEQEWNSKAIISDLKRIKIMHLCPILSTAYGLSISVPDDNVKCEPFRDIFKPVRGLGPEKSIMKSKKHDSLDQFDYMDDFDAWK